ncbi:MAG: hypothetical protein KGL39_22415 [Patescibacteria group bacterium]|nr:hypothetical protein [Patescibacteria group bacterium]
MNFRGKVVKPDWLPGALDAMEKFCRLYRENRIPSSVVFFMVVTDCRRVLRAAYGSDLRAAWALLWYALKQVVRELPWVVVRFWKYRVQMKSPDRELQEYLEQTENEPAD